MAWQKGKKHSKEQNEKIGKSLKEYFSSPFAKKKLSLSLEKRYSNPQERKKLSESLKKRYSNPSARKKLSASLKKRYANPLARRKMSASLKKYYSNPSSRLKKSKAMKNYFREHPLSKNPDYIKSIDRTITRWWKEHSHVKKERSEQIKKFFIKNPKKFQNFLKYGKNSYSPNLRTKQNFIVRSKGEQKIANFLYDNDIESSYEKEVLTFEKEGQICTPDFFLPKHKIYIEFYGGHPKAWKKKVMKNKLYKKHKIPCIFITPAELRDLNYYLKGELNSNIYIYI